MKTSQFITLTAISFGLNVLSVLAEGTFAGCFNYPNGGTYTSQMTTDPEVCASYCTTKYSSIYYMQYCFCTDNYGTFDTRYAADPNTCAPSGRNSLYVRSTTFDFANCATPGSIFFDNNENTQYNTATDLVDCFGQCKNSRYAALAYDSTQASYTCACGDELSLQTSETCSTTSTLVYTHPAGAAVSGLARRNAREALRRTRQAALIQVCPKGMTACVIPGLEGADAWECVDTQNDLESCGGCINGAYNNATAIAGQSCQNQVGVKMGATTCQAGQCVNYDCAPGYKLVDGGCTAL
ncbi:hypothetical protein I302_107016 [Kwoniella bestiolae CBS 10118]|uniref:Protein CPL1-like domain-containing protein n=1 Tax=Kwoniella bestiolae CBS 10118 TaxID=1296100 RepID=A0AAJ8KCF1_9TREE